MKNFTKKNEVAKYVLKVYIFKVLFVIQIDFISAELA